MGGGVGVKENPFQGTFGVGGGGLGGLKEEFVGKSSYLFLA